MFGRWPLKKRLDLTPTSISQECSNTQTEGDFFQRPKLWNELCTLLHVDHPAMSTSCRTWIRRSNGSRSNSLNAFRTRHIRMATSWNCLWQQTKQRWVQKITWTVLSPTVRLSARNKLRLMISESFMDPICRRHMAPSKKRGRRLFKTSRHVFLVVQKPGFIFRALLDSFCFTWCF